MNPKGTPSHYASLDGLRGVAAVIVLLYHIGEAHAVDRFTQMFNHGYLAVDFFFIEPSDMRFCFLSAALLRRLWSNGFTKDLSEKCRANVFNGSLMFFREI